MSMYCTIVYRTVHFAGILQTYSCTNFFLFPWYCFKLLTLGKLRCKTLLHMKKKKIRKVNFSFLCFLTVLVRHCLYMLQTNERVKMLMKQKNILKRTRTSSKLSHYFCVPFLFRHTQTNMYTMYHDTWIQPAMQSNAHIKQQLLFSDNININKIKIELNKDPILLYFVFFFFMILFGIESTCNSSIIHRQKYLIMKRKTQYGLSLTYSSVL